jgi:hypothetical protein
VIISRELDCLCVNDGMNIRRLSAVLLFVISALPCAAVMPANSETTLRSVNSFAMGGVGVAGTMSAGERALRQILKEPDAVSRLESMIPNATGAGKLYALLGLHARDRAAYERALEMCRSTDAKVETARGWMLSQESFRDLVKEIERGIYDASLEHEWPERAR